MAKPALKTKAANPAPKFMPAKQGFLGLSPEDAVSPEKAKAWVIPFGFECSVSYGGGTEKGPAAILDASHQVELFDDVFWKEAFRDYGVATMAAPEIHHKVEPALEQLEKLVEETLAAGKFPLTLGGEHSITPGAIRPFLKRHETLTILQFDAHADLRDGYEGEKYSHAAAMRRCLDHDSVRLVSVGIRNISASEIPFLEENEDRIKIFWAKDKKKWSYADIAKAVGAGPVYLTFDIDGFDSSMIPATGTPEPGGLFWDETMDAIAAVAAKADIVGADVVELAPQEGLHACDFLTAKLCYRILSYALT
ncbi:MAG TPA: agmatinase [Patescibacteria group bacterium]|nr:agmatinase [Patescibacteria group bacterium]